MLEELFRSFHSIKGISGMVELREAEMLAHEMESYLRALRQRDASLSQAGVDALIAASTRSSESIAARRDNRAAPPIGSALSRRLRPSCRTRRAPRSMRRSAGGAARRRAAWIVTFVPSAELSRGA